MNITVLHEVVGADAAPDEQDVLVEVQELCRHLRALGHAVCVVPLDLDLAKGMKAIQEQAPALVFNMVETIGGDGQLIHLAPSLLEHMRVPYTGSPLNAVYVTTNKVLTKRLLTDAGIATPPWVSIEQAIAGHVPFEGPYIVKPVWEDASVGLDDHCVASERTRLATVASEARERLRGEAFVEGFIDGREFNLSILEIDGAPRVLPPAEIKFKDYPDGKPRLVGYRAKWDESSFEYTHTPRSFELSSGDDGLVEQLATVATKCWHLLGLRGYARVDFRVDRSNCPWVLEVNVNPCLSADAGFMAACHRAGLSAADAISAIVKAAALT